MSQQHSKKRTHHDRSDLTGEHRTGDAGQIVLAILFAAVWVADSFFLKYTTFLNNYVPPGVRLFFGISLLICSTFFARMGLSIVFGENREKSVVIRKGIFNVVRHPIYLSEILLYLGLLILNISLAALVVWIIAICFLHYISRYEEKLLLDRFGDEYKKYMQEVPMWIPRIRKKQHNH